MRGRFSVTVIVTCALGCAAQAPRVDWSASPRVDARRPLVAPSATEIRLANGIRVVVIENHRLPIVAIAAVQLSAGGREDGASAGVAALTADLLDEGAGARDATQLAEALERAAARIDIYVASDYASVQVITTSDHIEATLDLLADMIRRPRLADADIQRVRERRLAELEDRRRRSRTIAAQLFDRIMFASHPYATPAEGTVAGLTSVEASHVRAFWRRAYRPEQLTLVVAGDVRSEALRPVMQRAFGDWTNTTPAASTPTRPMDRSAPQLGYIDVPGAEQSVVLIGRRGAAAADPHRLAGDVANAILGGGVGSRLDRELHDKLGIALAASTSFWRGHLAGTWSMTATVRTDATAQAIRTALSIIDTARKTDVAPVELARAKANLVRAAAQTFDTMAGTSRAFERLVAQELPLTWFADYERALARIDAAAVRGAAQAAWSDLSIVVVGDWSKIGAELGALGLPVVKYTLP